MDTKEKIIYWEPDSWFPS